MKKRHLLLPVLLLTASAALIIAGVTGDGHLAVMQKAIRICLECIGIG